VTKLYRWEIGREQGTKGTIGHRRLQLLTPGCRLPRRIGTMSDYLFAYGTLQPHCVPARMAPVVAKMRAVGKGYVYGKLYDLGGYPGAVPDPSSPQKITGTVLQLPEDASILRQFDAYEGFDPKTPEAGEYTRERQSVQLAAGGVIECWFYRYNWKPDASRAIESGAWPK
jgi:gamma-glutamylcyclotransferase (GGCT)/AIG2-like uncharacterized protein YtfP